MSNRTFDDQGNFVCSICRSKLIRIAVDCFECPKCKVRYKAALAMPRNDERGYINENQIQNKGSRIERKEETASEILQNIRRSIILSKLERVL